MLKGIPKIISPDLLKILSEMGHGDDIVIADGNFPAASNARNLIRCDGHGVPEILDAILKLFPLDTFVKKPVSVISVVGKEKSRPPIWSEFEKIIKKFHPDFNDFEYVKRFDFYERSRNAYAIISTTESALYACLILKKGILEPLVI